MLARLRNDFGSSAFALPDADSVALVWAGPDAGTLRLLHFSAVNEQGRISVASHSVFPHLLPSYVAMVVD